MFIQLKVPIAVFFVHPAHSVCIINCVHVSSRFLSELVSVSVRFQCVSVVPRLADTLESARISVEPGRGFFFFFFFLIACYSFYSFDDFRGAVR